MSQTFTKLFASITASTIWCEPAPTKVVWITMLAMADHVGRVHASVPGLAHIAQVTLTECQTALDTLLAPDRYSRSTAEEGRRIKPIDGGWQLINYITYRERIDHESAKEAKRKYIANRRKKEKQAVTINAHSVTVIDKESFEKK
jgi:hypothetical protein